MREDGVPFAAIAEFFGVSDRAVRYAVQGRVRNIEYENERKREWTAALQGERRDAVNARRRARRAQLREERAIAAEAQAITKDYVGEAERERLGRLAVERHGGALRILAEHDGPEKAERPPQGSALSESDIPTGVDPCPDETPPG